MNIIAGGVRVEGAFKSYEQYCCFERNVVMEEATYHNGELNFCTNIRSALPAADEEYNSERQNRESRYGEYNDLNLAKSGFHTPPLAGFVWALGAVLKAFLLYKKTLYCYNV